MNSLETTNLIKYIQVRLIEFEMYSGKADGVLGPQSCGALSTLATRVFNAKGGHGMITIPQGTMLSGKNPKVAANVLVDVLIQLGFVSEHVDGEFTQVHLLGYKKLFEIYQSLYSTTIYDQPWTNRVNSAFIASVKNWVEVNHLPEEASGWLLTVMCFETAGTFRPDIRNYNGSSGTGLIQFMETTAKGLGATTQKLAAMTQLEQLEYVYKYFKPYVSKIAKLEDMYLAVLYPKAIGYPINKVLFLEGSKAYTQNRGLDLDKNGDITVGEICSKIYNCYYDGMLTKNRRKLC